MDKLKEFRILKNEVYQTYLKEENENCINTANELIYNVNNSKIESKNSFLWYSNYSKSLIYMRLNDMESAIECAKESIKYINEVDIFNNEYSLSLLALARCYEEFDQVKAIRTYRTLSKVYRELTDYKTRINCIFNIAKIQLNFKAMQKLINIVSNTDTKSWYYTVDKEDYLSNMKKELDALKGI